jgi:hypothetical protein
MLKYARVFPPIYHADEANEVLKRAAGPAGSRSIFTVVCM